MSIIVKTDGLTKQYGKRKASNNINMTIERGEIYGLIGKNGAGKTTIMKMICGLSSPTSGRITLFDKDGKEGNYSTVSISALIEAPGIYPKLSGYDNLIMKCIAEGIRNREEFTKDILELVGLTEAAKKPAGRYSLGMRQRLGIGLALISSPEFVILDEPINGLDPQGIVEVRELIHKLNKERGITFMISSHILSELDRVATKFGIINEGILLEELTTEQLHSLCTEKIEVKSTKLDEVEKVLAGLGIDNYKKLSEVEMQIFEGESKLYAIAEGIIKNKIPFTNIGMVNESLEEYFIEKTGGDSND